ncbi:MAG: alpha/beta fold hydrolase [Solirubrobacterales bacterium]
MAAIELKRAGEFAYREALPDTDETGAPVVLLHGFPESSRMWEPLMERLTASGRRCLAPDLFGLGDSSDDRPATFERNLDAFARFLRGLEVGPVVAVVHDWGGFIGLAWAADHPARVAGLVISDTGFFSDGRWHGIAEAIRGEGGQELLAALDRDGFAGLLEGAGGGFDAADIDAYWQPFADEGRGRRATVEFYRSMDFSKLAPYEAKLYELETPALLLWGAEDRFAPVGGAHRLHKRMKAAELVVIDDGGHFIYDQAPDRCADEVLAFLHRRVPG